VRAPLLLPLLLPCNPCVLCTVLTRATRACVRRRRGQPTAESGTYEDLDSTSVAARELDKACDATIANSGAANDKEEMYSPQVVADVMAHFKVVCTNAEETPQASDREDDRPREYEDGEVEIKAGEMMLVFSETKEVDSIVFDPDVEIKVPEGGTCMRIACGDKVDDAVATVGRLVDQIQARKPRTRGGGKRPAEAEADPPTSPEPEEVEAADKARLEGWYNTLVRMARWESITRPIRTGAAHCAGFCECSAASLVCFSRCSRPRRQGGHAAQAERLRHAHQPPGGAGDGAVLCGSGRGTERRGRGHRRGASRAR
jgi:hypothetical protein